MAQVVLGAIGAGVGSAFGGAKGAQWGFSAGVLLAGILFPPRGQRQDHGKLDDLRVSGSQYGAMIPQVYGFGRVAGNLVWVQKDSAGNHLVESSRAIRASKGGSREVGRRYTYSATMAWLICKGPIAGVQRIWAEDKLIYDASLSTPSKYDITIHLGTESQTVNPDIEAAEGVSQWTGYRGQAYAVFDDFSLAEWGNRIPAMTFEVIGGVYTAGIAYDPHCLAYYRFEDSPGLLVDSGPNGWNLSETSSGATQTTGPTTLGEALSNTGSGNELRSTLGDQSRFQGSQLSQEVWYRYKGSGGGLVTLLYRNTAYTQYSGNLIISDVLGGSIDYWIEVAAGGGGSWLSYESAVIMDGNWHHVAVTHNTAGKLRLYHDGVMVQERTAPFASLAMTGGGNVLEIDDGPFYLDEAAWYDRELSAAEVRARYLKTTASPVSSVLSSLFDQVGIASGDYNTAAAATKYVPGFVLGSRVDVRQAVRELLMVTNLDLAEVDGDLVAVARGGSSVVTIPEADLGAYVAEGALDAAEPPDRVQARRLPVSELPYRLDLEYLSLTNDYQQGQATAVRFTRSAETQEQVTVSTPLVLHEQHARRAAETLLYRQWWERVSFVVTVGPKYLYLAPGDIVTIPVASSSVRCRIEQMDVDPFGVIQLTLVQDAAEILTQYVAGSEIPPPFGGLVEASTTTLSAWAGNALLDEHATDGKLGFYVAAGGPLGQDWPGAALYWSRDGGTTYTELDSLEDNATIGTAATVLAAPPGSAYDQWDDTNTVDVTITSGSAPETSSDSAVLNGANAAMLGDEVIQFVTVTSLGNNQYRLGRLLRGRRGTESYGASHAIGNRFVLLDEGRVKRVTVDSSLVGKTIHLKAVTIGTTVAAASAVTLDVSGDEYKCYAPTHITGARDGSNNLTIEWFRRARAGGVWADLIDVDQPEGTFAFEVDVMSGMTVLRTISTSSESASYTAAQQTTDGLTPGNPVTVNIYQLGYYGRGYVATATV